MTDLRPLIKQATEHGKTHSHVVVTLSEEGIHWRPESQEACQVMADIIGNCAVMTSAEFIATLERTQKEEAEAQ